MITTKKGWAPVQDKDIQFCIDMCADAINDIFGLTMPRVYMHTTKTTGGTCSMQYYRMGGVADAVILLANFLKVLPIEEIMTIVAHETAHFVANTLEGYHCGHSYIWQQYGRTIAKAVGINPDSIKQYVDENSALHAVIEAKQAQSKRYIIHCPKCGEQWRYASKTTAYRAIMRYRCGRCKVQLAYMGERVDA